MEAVTSTTEPKSSTISQTSGNQSGSSEKSGVQASSTQTASGDFSAQLLKYLGRSEKAEVNEEEFFSSLIAQRLEKESPEAASFYQEKVSALSVSMARRDGYVPVEDVAKAALSATVAEGKVSKAKAEEINGFAFNAAQLDSNKECLYDGRGTTRAVASVAEAMSKVKTLVDQIEQGVSKVSTRSLDIPSNRGTTPGPLVSLDSPASGSSQEASLSQGISGEASEKQIRFTWKHIASDGKLALLLPTRLNGQVDKVELFDSEGKKIEQGKYSKQTEDKRAVYRFKEAGAEYGKNIDVTITKKDGEVIVYKVKDGAKRTYVEQDDFSRA